MHIEETRFIVWNWWRCSYCSSYL